MGDGWGQEGDKTTGQEGSQQHIAVALARDAESLKESKGGEDGQKWVSTVKHGVQSGEGDAGSRE